MAVREEVVDDHANNGEEEDDESPENLIGNGTVRLEDFNCGTGMSACIHKQRVFVEARRSFESDERRNTYSMQ